MVGSLRGPVTLWRRHIHHPPDVLLRQQHYLERPHSPKGHQAYKMLVLKNDALAFTLLNL